MITLSPRGYGVSARTDVPGRAEVSGRAEMSPWMLSSLQDLLSASGVGLRSVGGATGVPEISHCHFLCNSISISQCYKDRMFLYCIIVIEFIA